MNPNVLTAAISAGAAVVTAIVALIVNARGFALLDSRISDTHRRIDDLNHRFDGLETRMDSRLSIIEADIKEFYKLLGDYDKRITRLEDKK